MGHSNAETDGDSGPAHTAACEEHLGPVVELTADYYWLVELDDAFNMNSTPALLGVGQLSDDLDELRNAPTDSHHEVWHELSHLLGPLARLAAQMGAAST